MCVFQDEEEDEEITAPPPVEDGHEEKDEQGEQQEEGENRNASQANSLSGVWLALKCDHGYILKNFFVVSSCIVRA